MRRAASQNNMLFSGDDGVIKSGIPVKDKVCAMSNHPDASSDTAKKTSEPDTSREGVCQIVAKTRKAVNTDTSSIRVWSDM